MGRGGGGAIRESTGRELRFHLRNQKGFREERRKAYGSAPIHGKTSALWFREARRCPRAFPGDPKVLILLCLRKNEKGQAFFLLVICARCWYFLFLTKQSFPRRI